LLTKIKKAGKKPTFNIRTGKTTVLCNAKIRPQHGNPIPQRPHGAFRFTPAVLEKSGYFANPPTADR
jgi:hypothetical protein